MKRNILKTAAVLLTAALLIFLDQLSKSWAVQTLKDAEDIVLIPGVFQLHYLENRGMAFGLLQQKQLFFFVMTVVILAAVLVILWKTPVNRRFFPVILMLALILAGAVGNMIDRVSQQFVVDFLYFSLIDFPVFNIADCYVTVSCILLIIFLLFVYKDDELTGVYSFRGKKDGTDTD